MLYYMMRNNYPTDILYWQKNRNAEIARNFNVHESSVMRKRNNLIKNFGTDYKCKVIGWDKWNNVDWSLSDEEIQKTWSGKKIPQISTIQKRRPNY